MPSTSQITKEMSNNTPIEVCGFHFLFRENILNSLINRTEQQNHKWKWLLIGVRLLIGSNFLLLKSFMPGDWKEAVCPRQASLRMHFHALKAQHGTHGGQEFRDVGFRVRGWGEVMVSVVNLCCLWIPPLLYYFDKLFKTKRNRSDGRTGKACISRHQLPALPISWTDEQTGQ